MASTAAALASAVRPMQVSSRERSRRAPLARKQIATGAVDAQRLGERLHRLLAHVGEIAGVAEALEQVGALLRRQAVGEAQRPPVLVLGLARGADRGGVLGGRGRVAQDGRRVGGRLGVMGEPRQVGRPDRRLGQRGESAAVQRDRPVRRERLLDRQPRQLVAEGDAALLGAKHARAQALLERVERAAGSASSSQTSARCGTTATASSVARAGALSRAARASTASRTVPGTPSVSAARASVTKNGLPPVRS